MNDFHHHLNDEVTCGLFVTGGQQKLNNNKNFGNKKDMNKCNQQMPATIPTKMINCISISN